MSIDEAVELHRVLFTMSLSVTGLVRVLVINDLLYVVRRVCIAMLVLLIRGKMCLWIYRSLCTFCNPSQCCRVQSTNGGLEGWVKKSGDDVGEFHYQKIQLQY